MALSEQTSLRLIGGGGVRGASGGAARVLSADPALDFFAASLRRHRAAADVVTHLQTLWSADPGAAHAPGLLAHLLGASDERIAGLSDVLLILSAEDWQRAASSRGVAFGREVSALLSRQFAAWTQQIGVQRRHPDRPLGVRLLCDGGAQMGGERLGLPSGSFVTGVLPNLYAGPAAGSRALLAVHLSMPGQWAGYREVARLYDDQDLLTLGGHWLDSAQVPALGAPALYRLRLDARDGLVHLLSPELGPSWRLVRHGSGEGPTVFSIHPPSGDVLGWLVLEVLQGAALTDTARPAATPVAVEQTAPVDRHEGPAPQVEAPTARHPVAVAVPAAPAAVDDQTVRSVFVQPKHAVAGATASPHDAPAVGLRLREVGLLLQRVHFPDVMQGYELYLDSAGHSSTFLDSPAVTLRVIGQRVALVAHAAGVLLDDAPMERGQGLELTGTRTLRLSQGQVQLVDLRDVPAERWPYLYALRFAGACTHALDGDHLRIGRDPACRIRLPDDPHNDNIVWRAQGAAEGLVQSRGGLVPTARFATDSIMVAQQHVEIEVGGAAGALGMVRCVADHCAAWLESGGRVQILSRRVRPTGPESAPLCSGAMLYVGNTMFQVDGGADGGPATPAAALVPAPVERALPRVDPWLPQPPPGELHTVPADLQPTAEVHAIPDDPLDVPEPGGLDATAPRRA